MLSLLIKEAALAALRHFYPDETFTIDSVNVNETKAEFKGDYTIVLFPFVKMLRCKPDELGQKLGGYLIQNKSELFTEYQIVSGFLNLTISDQFFTSLLQQNWHNADYGASKSTAKKIMVEYSSPNTNKPLHFGHLRNIFLGYALGNILKQNGNDVVKANLINDRGIHICKSMVAWQRYAHAATPQSTGIKGDHLVGDYYVKFNDEINKELAPILNELYQSRKVPDYLSDRHKQIVNQFLDSALKSDSLLKDAFSLDFERIKSISDGVFTLCQDVLKGKGKWKDLLKSLDTEDIIPSEKERKLKELKSILKTVLSLESEVDDAKAEIKEVISLYTTIMQEAQQMLRQWEAGDEAVYSLWQTMNAWVYEGFEVTYKKLGVDFDKMYYESNTYLLGKSIVEKGLEKGVLFKKEDNSVWIDLTDEGLDQKLLLRGDGTSVYITQDIGTAVLKYNDFNLDQSVYVIADEQNYHMQVLQLILKKMGEPCAEGIYHLSYGMVELPTGRMKSREGTVVDADDMIAEMVRMAQEQTEQAGKADGFSAEELNQLYTTIGMGALKFYLLRVDPKKKMIFDPKESIDLHGFTATFIQYAHARICSILRKEQLAVMPATNTFEGLTINENLAKAEKDILVALEQYPNIIETAATEMNPSVLCNYSFQLAQLFNTFYDQHSISKAENEEKKQLRLMMIVMVAQTLRHAMKLLGIDLPEKM